jgi:hypothetical protein
MVLEFVIAFTKVYIWDLGFRLANFFWDHVIKISIRQMNIQYIVFPQL